MNSRASELLPVSVLGAFRKTVWPRLAPPAAEHTLQVRLAAAEDRARSAQQDAALNLQLYLDAHSRAGHAEGRLDGLRAKVKVLEDVRDSMQAQFDAQHFARLRLTPLLRQTSWQVCLLIVFSTLGTVLGGEGYPVARHALLILALIDGLWLSLLAFRLTRFALEKI